MKNLTVILSIILFSSCGTSAQTVVDKSPDPDFHIYLCFGQSNMEGSAEIEAKDRVSVARFLMMPTMEDSTKVGGRRIGQWYSATPPLSQTRAGISPADYFGRTMVDSLPEEIKVGVVVVAVGGCDIRLFDRDISHKYDDTYPIEWFRKKIRDYGGDPYARLIEVAKMAQNDGVIKGILLHQGENNEGDTNWVYYVERVYEKILADLNLRACDVPLLAGQVVPRSAEGQCASMNDIIDKLPSVVPTAYVVSAEGCGVYDDKLHFNSEGVRELGRRYAEMMLKIRYGGLPE